MPGRGDAKRAVDYVFFALLAGVVVSPALAENPKDDYPLSTYPMFSSKKDRQTTVDQLVVKVKEGEEVILGPRYVGTDEVLQARATISRAVRGGAQTSSELCKQVAGRVAGKVAGATEVELRTVTFDAIAYFAEDARRPERTIPRARCAVPK